MNRRRKIPTEKAEIEIRSAAMMVDALTTKLARRYVGGALSDRETKKAATETVTHMKFVCLLINVLATGKCISEADLLRQFYVLSH